MPWLETNPVDQRLQFLEDVRLGRMSMSERCAHRQISRKTGDKWIARVAEEGRRGVADVGECTVFLTSMTDCAAINAEYIRFFPVDPPSRATLWVTALPRPAARVEIKCSARVRR